MKIRQSQRPQPYTHQLYSTMSCHAGDVQALKSWCNVGPWSRDLQKLRCTIKDWHCSIAGRDWFKSHCFTPDICSHLESESDLANGRSLSLSFSDYALQINKINFLKRCTRKAHHWPSSLELLIKHFYDYIWKFPRWY